MRYCVHMPKIYNPRYNPVEPTRDCSIIQDHTAKRIKCSSLSISQTQNDDDDDDDASLFQYTLRNDTITKSKCMTKYMHRFIMF
jgi:hypothetical protein